MFDEIKAIAQICHDVLGLYDQAIGGPKHQPWDELNAEQKDLIVGSVEFCFLNPHAGPSKFHYDWQGRASALGWGWGVEYSATQKLDPLLKQGRYLNRYEWARVYLFGEIVHSLRGRLNGEPKAGV